MTVACIWKDLVWEKRVGGGLTGSSDDTTFFNWSPNRCSLMSRNGAVLGVVSTQVDACWVSET